MQSAVLFVITENLLLAGTASTVIVLLGTTITSIGSAIGQIIIAPFNVGVIVLLYTDRRIPAEVFDLVLQTGADSRPYAVVYTHNLWRTRLW